MKKLTVLTLSSIALCFLNTAASAATAENESGWYAGAGIGTAVGLTDKALTSVKKDEDYGTGAKIYYGYRLNRHFAVESGYLKSRNHKRLVSTGQANPAEVWQPYSPSAFYGTAVVILPVTESFGLHTKLGVSMAKENLGSAAGLAAPNSGSKTSVFFGIGGEYKLTSNLAVVVDYEGYKASQNLTVGTFNVGGKFSF